MLDFLIEVNTNVLRLLVIVVLYYFVFERDDVAQKMECRRVEPRGRVGERVK